MQIINVILVIFLALVLISPIIFIPIALLYNFQIDRIQKRLEKKTNERNAQVFLAWFIFGPLFKSEKRWIRLVGTFNRIYNCKDIKEETKNKLLNVYKDKGCNPLLK